MMKDLSGTQINDVTVVSFNRKEGKNYFWNCRCVCGKEFATRRNNLYHPLPIKSCGCKRGRGIWKGHGEIGRSYYSQLQNNASKRNIDFDIPITSLWSLFLKQNRRCALTGVELNFAKCLNRDEQSASLDRIDSSRGYVLGNVQWVHKDINAMKQGFPLDSFKKWCKMVTEYESSV